MQCHAVNRLEAVKQHQGEVRHVPVMGKAIRELCCRKASTHLRTSSSRIIPVPGWNLFFLP